MAEIVLGIGSSHTAQLRVPGSYWALGGQKDQTDRRFDYQALLARAKPGVEQEVTPERFAERYAACQRGMETIADRIMQAAPDVIVVVGDDQEEQFHADNMPMFCIFHGDVLPVGRRRRRELSGPVPAAAGDGRSQQRNWLSAQVLPELKSEYPGAPALANHLIRSLAKAEFDIARSNRLREDVGLGHAFTYLFQLLPDCTSPVVPFMVNTYYPPNAPTPKRCYALGQALRPAIESWPDPARVAVMASGGLSHQVIDEEIDQMTLNGLLEKGREALCALPEERLTLGTSEIRNWVVLAGAMEPLAMTLIDYIPAYRSLAGTGCAMGFASWS
jgi:hypothetical protein